MSSNRKKLQDWHDAGVIPYELNEYVRKLKSLEGNFNRPYDEIAKILGTTRGHATQILCWSAESIRRWLNHGATGEMAKLDESSYNMLRRGGVDNDESLEEFLAGRREVKGIGKVRMEKIRRLLCRA